MSYVQQICDGYNKKVLMGNWYEENLYPEQPFREKQQKQARDKDQGITCLDNTGFQRQLPRLERRHKWETSGRIILDDGFNQTKSVMRAEYPNGQQQSSVAEMRRPFDKVSNQIKTKECPEKLPLFKQQKRRIIECPQRSYHVWNRFQVNITSTSTKYKSHSFRYHLQTVVQCIRKRRSIQKDKFVIQQNQKFSRKLQSDPRRISQKHIDIGGRAQEIGRRLKIENRSATQLGPPKRPCPRALIGQDQQRFQEQKYPNQRHSDKFKHEHRDPQYSPQRCRQQLLQARTPGRYHPTQQVSLPSPLIMHVYVYYQTTIIKDLFIIVMSFAQYCIHNSTLPIKEVSEQSVSLMVPIDADSFLILLTNNKYLCYRIRSQQIIFSGELPKQFIASQYIKPLINFRQDFIYFLNSQASICKLNFKENTAQIRTLVLPDKTFKLESIEASYQIMDPHGTFLLGRVQNTQNKTCTIFVYDWLKQVYSNALSLGPTFFNFKVSNFLDHRFAYEVEFELCAKKFVIVSEEGNKIYYNYICWNINYNQNNKTTNSSKQIGEVDQLIVLKQSSRKFIQCQYFPVVPILVDTTLYVIANHHQGFYLIRISIQENSHRKIKLKLTEQLEQKGIIKRYLGIIDGNILFTIFNLKSKHQNICTIPWNSLEKPTPNQTQIAGHLLLSVESKRDVAGNQIISNIFPSINGFSFHKYQFVCEKIVKLCRKQNPDYPSQLSIQTIYRVPKKYFYSEMSQLIGFTPGLTHEMLDLL